MIKKGGIEGKLTSLSNSIRKVKTAATTVGASPRYKTVCLYLVANIMPTIEKLYNATCRQK
ncbi:MAG TPA: hypothetical protein DD791_08480 [Syntrophomonas sp.]|jgi:hypothetical protein|nr:hypothetical protein [Syntrophomonas sp.]